MGPPHTIDSVLQELKNTSNPSRRFSLQTEFKALQFLLQNGHSLLYFRQKIFSTEVDFLLWSPSQHFVVVEVKSLNNPDLMPYRITPRQKKRLLRVRQLLENVYRVDVEVLCVFVMKEEILTITLTE